MFPLLPFALGALAGAAAVSLARRGKDAVRLDKAQDRIRQAAACGLAAVERSSAQLREKLAPANEPPMAAADESNAPPADESRPAQGPIP